MNKFDIDAALQGTKYDNDKTEVTPSGYMVFTKGQKMIFDDAKTNAALVEVLAKALERILPSCKAFGLESDVERIDQALAQYKERDAK